MTVRASTNAPPPGGLQFRIGVAVIIVGFLSPLLVPLVAATDLPTGWKTTLSGLLLVGIPELFSLVAVAIMGKSGFNYLKARIFGLLKKHGPPDRVSRTRYRIGLVMFVLPILFGWLAPYVPQHVPGYEMHRVWINLGGDLMLVVSLFVLGGDFWNKLRGLFLHNAKIQVGA